MISLSGGPCAHCASEARRHELLRYERPDPARGGTAQLEAIAAAGGDPARRSRAMTLVGVILLATPVRLSDEQLAALKAAIKHLQTAIEIDPNNDDAKFNLEFALRQRGVGLSAQGGSARIPRHPDPGRAATGSSGSGTSESTRGTGDARFLTPGGALVALAVLVPVAAFVASRDVHRVYGGDSDYARLSLRVRLLPVVAILAVAGLLGLAATQPASRATSTRYVRSDAEALPGRRRLALDARAAKPRRSSSRLERASPAGVRLRASLPSVPMGIASMTNRVLPNSSRARTETSLGDAGARNRHRAPPPGSSFLAPDQPVATNVSSLESLAHVATQRFYSPAATHRLLVVFTDGESTQVSEAAVARRLRRARIETVFVQFWDADEQVFTKGSPELRYKPDPAARSILDRLATAAGGSVYDEGSLDSAMSKARDLLGSGPTVASLASPRPDSAGAVSRSGGLSPADAPCSGGATDRGGSAHGVEKRCDTLTISHARGLASPLLLERTGLFLLRGSRVADCGVLGLASAFVRSPSSGRDELDGSCSRALHRLVRSTLWSPSWPRFSGDGRFTRHGPLEHLGAYSIGSLLDRVGSEGSKERGMTAATGSETRPRRAAVWAGSCRTCSVRRHQAGRTAPRGEAARSRKRHPRTVVEEDSVPRCAGVDVRGLAPADVVVPLGVVSGCRP